MRSEKLKTYMKLMQNEVRRTKTVYTMAGVLCGQLGTKLSANKVPSKP